MWSGLVSVGVPTEGPRGLIVLWLDATRLRTALIFETPGSFLGLAGLQV